MDTLRAGMQRRGLLGQLVTAANMPEVIIAGQPVIDFAATNYLGLNRHPQVVNALTAAAAQWGISLGTPRRYADTWLVRKLETMLAHLAGQESALLFPSTTHLALDVIPALAGDSVVLIDREAYPLSWQGAHLAASNGKRIFSFPHNNLQVLESYLQVTQAAPSRLIVVDGVYPAGSKLAPLAELQALASAWNAWLYVDDAHGFGVLGAEPNPRQPFGYGGSGSPAYWQLPSGRILHVASLSKAFGVPLAFVAGPQSIIDQIQRQAGSLEHSSPVAFPLIAAAQAALDVHRREGEARRRNLLAASRCLRDVLSQAVFPIAEDRFPPIQSLLFDDPHQAYTLASHLRRCGIWAVLQFQPHERPNGAALRFFVSACHSKQHISRLARVLKECSGDL